MTKKEKEEKELDEFVKNNEKKETNTPDKYDVSNQSIVDQLTDEQKEEQGIVPTKDNENIEVEAEEDKEDNTPASNVQFYPPENVLDADETVKQINDARAAFADFHKKTMKNTKIFQFAFLAVVASAILVASFYPGLLTIVFGLVAIYFIMVFFQSNRTKKRVNALVEEYIVRYGLLIDSYVFGKNYMVKEPKFAYRNKLDQEVLVKNDIYKNVIKTSSRDYVEGQILGANFWCTDVSFKTGASLKAKDAKVPAVGKMLKINARLKEEGKVIVYLSNTKEGRPTNLDGLEEIKISSLSDKFEVYASSKEAASFINTTIAKSISNFEITEDLIDVVITVTNVCTYVLLSYSDKVMVIPYDKPYEKASLEQYNKDMVEVVTFVGTLVNSPDIEKF